jgi:hypothetical protein
MNQLQLNTINAKLRGVAQEHLFALVVDLVASLNAMFEDPSFTHDVDSSLNGLYDYAIADASKPGKTQLDIALKFTADGPFYYFPLVIKHESI